VTRWGRHFGNLLSLLVPLFAPLSVIFGGAPRPLPGAAFPVALNEKGHNRLLTEGMPDGDVEKLLRGLQLVTAKLMHQGSTVRVGLERRDDGGVADLGELMTLSGETSDVVLQGFALFLSATLQILEVAESHVCALKVTDEDHLEILPTIDRASG
jgi:hypothetical protein